MMVCYWRLQGLDLLFLTPFVVEMSVSDAFKRLLDLEALRSDGQRLRTTPRNLECLMGY